jgi:hypothetical protein
MENDFSLLSNEYDPLFAANYRAFREKVNGKGDFSDKDYCVIYPSFGTRIKEDIDFIIYGQAPKGWQEIKSSDPIEITKAARRFSNTTENNQNNPLDWVNQYWSASTKRAHNLNSTYSTCRSFFWNVTYKLISDYRGLGRNSPEWCNYMVWSNLIKIAPAHRVNPGDKEIAAQEEHSVKLFKKEIEEITPKYIILLTNKGWAKPFVSASGIKELENSYNPKIIEWVGEYLNTKIVVTTRPFTGSSDNHVEEIRKVIGYK